MKNLTGLFDNISGYPGHAHFWERALTRRGFLTTAAGTLGLVLGSRAWMPKLLDAAPQTSGIFPRPIPGGIQPFGPGTEVFHVFLPGPGAEPSTITDFHGFVGVTEITGNVTRRNQRTGATDVLVFDNDMRFMQGHYIGVDGREHNGTFGFFWIDVFESPGGPQVTSIDPGNIPGGLFWTIPISSDSVEIELGAGRARYALDSVGTLDFHDIVNDLQHGPSVPVTASFRVQWTEKTHLFQKRNAAVGFRGEFVETTATMEWSASEADFSFVSAPADTSTSLFAMLGQEHNGVFF